MNNCIVCSAKLSGQQRLYCSMKCKYKNKHLQIKPTKPSDASAIKKKCTDCGKSKPVQEFTFRRDVRDGTKIYGDRCHQCHGELIKRAGEHSASPKRSPVKKDDKGVLKVTRRNGKFEPLVGGM